jgi:hypothetical protein
MPRDIERTGRPDLRAIENRVGLRTRQLDDAVSALQGGALSGAVRLADVALTTSAQDIRHGLGRAWVGAIVTKSDGRALAVTSTRNDEVFIGLALDSAATVDVVVF